MLLKVAYNVLGLKKYEEFEVVQCNVTRVFRFSDNALEWWNGAKWVEDRDVLYEILNRECDVKFKDYLPLVNEFYFTIDDVVTSQNGEKKIGTVEYQWKGSVVDYLRYMKGLVFKNREQAELKVLGVAEECGKLKQ